MRVHCAASMHNVYCKDGPYGEIVLLIRDSFASMHRQDAGTKGGQEAMPKFPLA